MENESNSNQKKKAHPIGYIIVGVIVLVFWGLFGLGGDSGFFGSIARNIGALIIFFIGFLIVKSFSQE